MNALDCSHELEGKLTLTFTALSDPTRRAILSRLSKGEATVQELSAPFQISAPAITKHLKVLERAGLISRGKSAQWRPCRIEVAPLRDVSDWIGEYRRFWEESFDRLDSYLRTMTTQKRGRRYGKKNKTK